MPLDEDYMNHRQNLSQSSAADELLSRVSGERQNGQMQLSNLATGKKPEQKNGIVKDIALGTTVELPRAIVKGVRDAYQSTINLGDEVGTWVEDKLNLPVLELGKQGISFKSHDEAKNYPRLADKAVLPDIAPPKTVTGNVIKGVAQFMTGMKGMSKLGEIANVPEIGGAAGYAISSLKGAGANFTAFEGHQKRLSDLIQEYPALQNPVTEFLSSKPDDSEAEGRFKNALEGLGLGVLTDGFIKGVKAVRQFAKAKSALNSADELSNIVSQPKEPSFSTIGNESDSSLVKVVKPPKLPAGEAGKAAEPEVFINFARIDTPDDVKNTIQQLANLGKKAIDAERRGKMSFKDIQLNADQQNAWDILLTRRSGQPLNAEQSVAARNLWASSAQKVKDLALMASESPSEENLFAFRKMLSIHATVQNQVIAARTETARALASWRIPTGATRMQDIEQALNLEGGPEVTRELAKRVSALAQNGLYQELDSVIEKGAGAKTIAAVQEAWINGLLSNPTTHMANMLSNTSVLGVRITERKVGEKIAALLGSEDSIAAGESTQQWFGLVQGAKDMARYYTKAIKAKFGGEAATPPTQELGISSATKLEYKPSISSEAFGLSNTGFLGKAADYGGMLIRTPGSLLQHEDELFKTLGYRMELNAQALRQATKEVNQGLISQADVKGRIAELIQNPPANLHISAVDSALYQTFTNAPGKMAQGLARMTNQYPALKVLLPFVRTPANIMKFTFERTPLAPAMKGFRADIAAGGARRDLALAQMATGSTLMFAVADMAMNGQVTGRGPIEMGQKQAMYREGWQPYSVKLGDRWVSYNRLDPVGSLIGLAADASETMMNAQHDALDDPDTEKLAVAASVAFAGNIVNKTYLSGLSSFIAALNEPTISAESWAQRLAGSVVPSIAAGVERTEDPTVREVYSMMDAIAARTPGLSSDLPARIDLWGDPVKLESGIGKPFDFLSPIYTAKPTPEPIDQEILRLDANITMPGRNTSFNGVSIDLAQYPKAYQRYVQLAGNELKHPAWGLGAKDLLNEIVQGNHPLSQVYNLRSDGPDGGKDVFIRDTIRQYRELARRQLLTEFPELNAEVEKKKSRQTALKMPVLQ